MVMKTTKIIHLLTVSFLIMLSACVGKIEEANVPNTTQFVTDPVLFSYTGIVTANPVAHDKIEITFQKVAGATSDYIYKLYVNDSENGTEMSLSSLTTHMAGRYYFLVSNLTINTEYKFKVRAFNKKTGGQSKDEISLEAKTFNNVVADFKGIINLQNVPGQESRAIRVKWDKVPYFVASPSKPNDPVRYEVIYASGSPAELFNPQSTFRRVRTITPITVATHPTEVDIDDLSSDTTYYFTVRAVHRIYANYENAGASYIPVDRENNTKFLSLKTSASEGAPGFNPANFNVSNSLSDAGYTSVETTWARSWGAFYAMKIIYKQSTVDFVEQDFIDIPLKQPDGVSGVRTITDPFTTRLTLTNLTPNAIYQFKLLLCKTPASECTISGVGSTVADRSSTKFLIVKPSLASFMGLNNISHPESALALNEITLNFDPPVTSIGWADGMKFYCTGNNGTHHLLSQTPINDPTNGGVCNGLTRGAMPGDVSSMTEMKVIGIVLGGTEYCFSATPYLSHGSGISVQLTDAQRIQRCITPEIRTPTLQQFAGMDTSVVNANRSITSTWITPTGGIFDRYVVFWKKRTETSTTSTFSFNNAITEFESTYSVNSGIRNTNCGEANYCFETLTGVNTHTTQTNLSTGVHEVGILSLVSAPNPQGALIFYWSQINVKVKSSEIFPSKADFKGWTRIFAIGPKRNIQKSDASSAYTTEAIDSNGVPYEPGNNLVNVFFQPPGQSLGLTPESQTETDPDLQFINLNNVFDGKRKNAGFGSNSGIVSLAWEDVVFNYANDNGAFVTPQNDALARNSTGRKYGYRVFRSDDNRISWTDLTNNEAFLIHSRNFNYKARPNGGTTTARMAFFTDYSVQNLEAVSSSNHLQNGTEQARVYWYKIIPYFNGKPVTITNPNASMVRVTLPPPNMALVHRWMANRSQCLELGLPVRIDNNYSCTFTGLGAVQENYPFNPGSTKIDLKSDLLIDRFELGCNFSRGPETLADQGTLKDQSLVTISDVNSTSSSYKGCYKVVPAGYTLGANDLNPLPGVLSSATTVPTDAATLKTKLLFGDCIGESYDTSTPRSWCTASVKSYGGYSAEAISLPGYTLRSIDSPTQSTDCDTFYQSKRVGVNNVSDISGFGSFPITNDRFSWLKRNAAQSNFLNVYHNSYTISTSYPEFLVGLTGSTPRILSANAPEPIRGYAASCSINLAAIDGGNNNNELIPRWANLNFLTGSYDASITLTKSPSEIRSNPVLYGGSVFNAPTIPAYIPNLPIGKIMTTNDAGAPPLMRVDRPVAASVCGLYKVNVMVVKDGKTPSAVATNLPKRLLRKREFIASNMWPETFATGAIDYLEGISDEYSGALLPDQATQKTQCAHTNAGTTDLSRWSTIPDRLASHPYFSGSRSTSNCISRYGIQDLVGNMDEMSSEKLFCGYSPITLRYGAINSQNYDDHFLSNGVDPEYSGNDEKAYVDLSRVNSIYSEHWYLLKRGWKNGAYEYFKIQDSDGSSTPDQIFSNIDLYKPYIKDTVGAGYCSMVDDSVDRREDPQEAAVLAYGDVYRDLFFKTFNEALVKKHGEITDKGYVPQFRDGDGYFLDFGPSHMANAILNKNSLSFPWKFSLGSGGLSRTPQYGLTLSGVEFLNNVFFSSILGIPLSCGDAPGYNNRCPSAQEKRLIEEHTDFYYLDRIGNRDETFPTDNVDTQFYVGGSKIENEGLREVYVFTRSVQPPATGAANVNNYSITTGVQLSTNVDQLKVNEPVTTVNKPLTYFEATQNVEFWDVWWQLPRQTTLYFTQGGHYNKSQRVDQHNGRFSTQIGRSLNYETGFRCAVSINEVD
jgi:hypothetical protein